MARARPAELASRQRLLQSDEAKRRGCLTCSPPKRVEVSAFGKRDQIEREAIRGMSRHLAQTYGSGRAVLRVGRRRIEIYDEDTASTVIDLRDGGGR